MGFVGFMGLGAGVFLVFFLFLFFFWGGGYPKYRPNLRIGTLKFCTDVDGMSLGCRTYRF